MSADDKLRRAATLIRDTANAAYPGTWAVVRCDGHARGGIDVHEAHVEVRANEGEPDWIECGPLVADLGPTLGHLDDSGPHIALWDPATALYVADWLDATADAYPREIDRIVDIQDWHSAATYRAALALANDILKETP
ncbi:hypothetical protein [Sanguibacter sp. HDW7]|uniref:hypothetical protein n=1 Tax=Sanguibacter sp. HDW7 TaxID=2714931 RepID=UPI00140AE747|nr:hypothetical protein [Sanguibacter sp. HDW7]QIK82420.1 hypothetical protein G7063_01415 [Sanguibacter sp. HDW7]